MKTVVIAGAAGYMGRALIKALAPEYHIIALSRRSFPSAPEVEWRGCDLFDPAEIDRAIEGADYAIYLVHSMLPAELTQSHFADMDLLLADNFARIAKKKGLRQIIYLGGLIPDDKEKQALSQHLASRLEVEEVLGSHGVPVTALRAGIIIGAEGSSFRMMLRLVKHLPVIFCPPWTHSHTQPVALADVVATTIRSIGREELYGKSFDIGGPQVMTYLEMMQLTASELHLPRFIITLPFLPIDLSVLWVNLITGAHTELIYPLVESLKHNMVARNLDLQKKFNLPLTSFEEALHTAVEEELRVHADEETLIRHLSRAGSPSREKESAFSIQRMILPPSVNAMEIAMEYGRWLTQFLRPFVKVVSHPDQSLSFYVLGIDFPILFLKHSEGKSNERRAVFMIRGGLLCRQPSNLQESQGWLEIRLFPERNCFIIGIFKFHPSLPWWLYKIFQAPFHMFVMERFGKHLKMISAKK